MTILIKGIDLTPAQRLQVFAAFTYRTTKQNGYPKRNPCQATVTAINDDEWIQMYAFWFTNDGKALSRQNGQIHAEII